MGLPSAGRFSLFSELEMEIAGSLVGRTEGNSYIPTCTVYVMHCLLLLVVLFCFV